jgi:hypothetical protein
MMLGVGHCTCRVSRSCIYLRSDRITISEMMVLRWRIRTLSESSTAVLAIFSASRSGYERKSD